MRLSDVLLAAAIALIFALDATSATSDATLPKPNSALASAESTRNDHRFLRKHKAVDVEQEENEQEIEERGVGDWLAAKTIMARLALASNDDKGRIISEIRDAGVLAALFIKKTSPI
ncbi:hypothetical protein ON010_g8321 [Phytophthora cinnamomi]|nr:hypothetical protein ON010_g8321 [Phytophthora cinnamomi]